MTFRHSRNLPAGHRDRVMAKRELYGAYRKTRRPFGLIELFTTAERRKLRLPHQGVKECARRIRQMNDMRPTRFERKLARMYL